MKKFGLIGYPLGHSFSRKYFREKFEKLGLEDHTYELFEIPDISEFPNLWQEYPDLVGLNVTVPHKENVLPYLDHHDESVRKVGAANVIQKKEGKLTGYNTDYHAFKTSLHQWIGDYRGEALILGTGGSSKAVKAALQALSIPSRHVSRQEGNEQYTYRELHDQPGIMQRYHLIINTTPVGMHPHVENCPDIPYATLTENHFLFDLVYNPETTTFMKKGSGQGAHVKNGIEMLHLQAERSWDIWNNGL